MTIDVDDYLWCSSCNANKLMGDFWSYLFADRGGEVPICNYCVSILPEEIDRVLRRKTLARAPPTDARKYHLKSVYGISTLEYQRLFDQQGGVCAICKKPNDCGRRLSVDHDHKTGKVRGLLCGRCNTGLGYFRDDARVLIRAARYLRS